MQRWNVKLLIGPYAYAPSAHEVSEQLQPLGDRLGDRLRTFVHVGYHGSKPPLPCVSIRATLEAPTAGDASSTVAHAVRGLVDPEDGEIFDARVWAAEEDWLTRLTRGTEAEPGS